MKRTIYLFVILPLLTMLPSCGPSSGSGGVLGFGPADWMEITYYHDQPGPSPSTVKYTETDSDTAPGGYDPYIDADVIVITNPDRLNVDMRSEHIPGTSSFRYDLKIRVHEAIVATHNVVISGTTPGTAAVSFTYDGMSHYGYGGTVTITQLPDAGYIKGNFDISLQCSPTPCSGLASIVGSFSATRSL